MGTKSIWEPCATSHACKDPSTVGNRRKVVADFLSVWRYLLLAPIVLWQINTKTPLPRATYVIWPDFFFGMPWTLLQYTASLGSVFPMWRNRHSSSPWQWNGGVGRARVTTRMEFEPAMFWSQGSLALITGPNQAWSIWSMVVLILCTVLSNSHL